MNDKMNDLNKIDSNLHKSEKEQTDLFSPNVENDNSIDPKIIETEKLLEKLNESTISENSSFKKWLLNWQ